MGKTDVRIFERTAEEKQKNLEILHSMSREKLEIWRRVHQVLDARVADDVTNIMPFFTGVLSCYVDPKVLQYAVDLAIEYACGQERETYRRALSNGKEIK